MSSFTHPIAMSAPLLRSVAIAALMGTTMLAAPLSAARAEQTVAAQNQAAAGAMTETKGETVEQRITNLHAALKITPEQDANWNNVAQAMRENAAAMDKLIATSRTTAPQSMTAVEDLKVYQQFAQAHVDGLKNLISSFQTLYGAMTDAQKKVADSVFNTSRTETGASRG
jgi:periplasmic protein CpxP/Spy